MGVAAEPREVVFAQLAHHVHGKVVRQQHDVFAALAQRRQRNDVERQSVQKVEAKLALGREVGQIFVGGSNKADIHAAASCCRRPVRTRHTR